MTTIARPSFLENPRSCIFELDVNQRGNASPFGGSEQIVDMMTDRWTGTVTIVPRTKAEGAAVEAFVGSMRGMSNTVDLYHLVRPVPRGTMRGTPITNPAAKGADQMVIGTSLPFVTLLAGDMIGIGGLLVMVREDCVANGVGAMTVKFTNRLRKAVGGSLPVIWDRPTAPFRLPVRPAVSYVPGYVESVTFEFVEAIA